MLSFWQDCSRVLERELSPQQFAAWIAPLKAIDFDASTGDIHLRAPNRLKLDAVRAQFGGRIQAVASLVLKRPVNVLFELEATEAADPEAVGGEVAVINGTTDVGVRAAPEARTAPDCLERARLNPALTFDTFVTGKANQLARAAAHAGGREPRRLVQPAVPVRRRGPGQDPPDPRHRQQLLARQGRRRDPLHPRRAIRLATW